MLRACCGLWRGYIASFQRSIGVMQLRFRPHYGFLVGIAWFYGVYSEHTGIQGPRILGSYSGP